MLQCKPIAGHDLPLIDANSLQGGGLLEVEDIGKFVNTTGQGEPIKDSSIFEMLLPNSLKVPQ